VITGVEPLEPRRGALNVTRQRMRRAPAAAIARSTSGSPSWSRRRRSTWPMRTLRAGHRDDVPHGALGEPRGDEARQPVDAELGRAFGLIAPYRDRRKVSIFGSARTAAGDPHYAIAKDFAHEIATRGWMVITGAGPGIMEAGHAGAGAEASFGVGIKLPVEQSANGFIAGDPKLIDFKYFFTRKIMFMKESDAFVLLPGGYGTMDEAFELLTLMQTGKTPIRPVCAGTGERLVLGRVARVRAGAPDRPRPLLVRRPLARRACAHARRCRGDHRALLRELRVGAVRRRAAGDPAEGAPSKRNSPVSTMTSATSSTAGTSSGRASRRRNRGTAMAGLERVALPAAELRRIGSSSMR
jgi:uncharacterized protein (TIGR00730 family)